MSARSLAIAVIAACLLPLSAKAADPDSARYRDCLAVSSIKPAAALADADGWAKAGGGAPALHCAALALIQLKRYGDAGARLDRAAGAAAVPDLAFRAVLFTQAGNAWLLAGNGAKAAQSFSAALALSPGDADLYADLARAQAMRRNWPEAELRLGNALQLAPRRADLLVLRASARRALKRYGDARNDVEAALKLKPGDGEALLERGLLRQQLGDLGGARRDFQAAMKSSSDEAAAQARENLEALKP
ncbi:MAG: tetratricopeptide repeat protein [Pseudomonadota bacterium]